MVELVYVYLFFFPCLPYRRILFIMCDSTFLIFVVYLLM